jgi:hypothetical protein
MLILKNPRHEAFAQALTRGMSAAAAYAEVGYRPHRHNAATLARQKHISARLTALTAKAKLAGMWREKVDQHNTGSPTFALAAASAVAC